MGQRTFPSHFIFGAATSAYQIEGAANEDGRGPSIWDHFSLFPGTIKDGSDGKRACDHYHHLEDDLDLMKKMGLQAYRFSISWPRVQPTGKGGFNPKGLDFYQRLVDGLMQRGITPYATLFHWDLPLRIEGAWLNRDVTDRFAEYSFKMVKALGDRTKHWMTINEPWCIAELGYRRGEHAPGVKDPRSSFIAAHHALLAHGKSAVALRTEYKDLQVGIALNLCPAYPASDSYPDREACERFDGEFNRWYLDPLFRGQYPEDIMPPAKKECGDRGFDFVQEHDLELIKQPLDFLGINYYSRAVVRGDERSKGQRQRTLGPSRAMTAMGWEVYPQGLVDLLRRVHKEYQPKSLLITENGAAYPDRKTHEGRVEDKKRSDYIHMHLLAALEAIDEGVPVDGYFLWSLLDNFEWAYGYTQRFGVVHVDFQTLERTWKDSAKWYRGVIENRSLVELFR